MDWHGKTHADALSYRAMTAPPRVLIVDDDRAICEAYREILSAEGYEVFTAGSGREALEALDELSGKVDVLILDIGLPDADGTEVAREIVARIGNRPTLYVSGLADDFWQLGDAPGRWRVRQKPIPIPWLVETVRWLADGDKRED
jgi:CheY-like chemotaxis protein